MAIGMGRKTRASGSGETIKIIIQALLIAIFVRVFLFQPFNIPSGSMKSTLLVGDYLFVSKLTYGYSRYSFPWAPNLFEGRIFAGTPERGDVVVFKLPRDNETDYIKRVIGLPGDEIIVRNGVVFINGEEVKRVRSGVFHTFDRNGIARRVAKFRETLPNGVSYTVLDAEVDGPFDNVGPYKVPEGHYFMMGDNRDNSTDSRAIWGVGYVPYQNLVGRAEIIFFSSGNDDEVADGGWTWPGAWLFTVRWGRFFRLVD